MDKIDVLGKPKRRDGDASSRQIGLQIKPASLNGDGLCSQRWPASVIGDYLPDDRRNLDSVPLDEANNPAIRFPASRPMVHTH